MPSPITPRPASLAPKARAFTIVGVAETRCNVALLHRGIHPNPYDTPAERQRIARAIHDAERDLRIIRWQRRVAIACYVIAVATACYFAFQMGRGL